MGDVADRTQTTGKDFFDKGSFLHELADVMCYLQQQIEIHHASLLHGVCVF